MLAAALLLGGCVASSSDRLTAGDAGEDGGAASASSYAAPDRETRAARQTGAGGSPAAAAPASTAPVALNASERAQAASEIAQVTAVSTPGSVSYRVGPLDVLDVTVFKVPDLTQTVQVSEAGTFGYPLVGEVHAGGRTVREIENDLASKLGASYLRNPRVTVLVKEYNSHRITVEGAVKKAGVFPMQGPMSLMQAIATAGGLEEVSDGSILLFRRVDGETEVGRFSINDLRAQRADDPDLKPGDIVMVPASDLRIGLQYILRAAPLVNALRPF